MALVGEAAYSRDFRYWRTRVSQQLTRMLDSSLANELSNGTAVILVKLTREMDVMHADFGSDLGKGKPLQEPGFDDLRRPLQPLRGRHPVLLRFRAGDFS